jgi:hypothetical protein
MASASFEREAGGSMGAAFLGADLAAERAAMVRIASSPFVLRLGCTLLHVCCLNHVLQRRCLSMI